jgi:hypothetical protein
LKLFGEEVIMAKSKNSKKQQIKKLIIKKSKLTKRGFQYLANQVQFDIDELKQEVGV